MISTERQTRETHAVIFKVNAFMLTKWTQVVFGGRRENMTWMKKCERKWKQRKGKGKVRVWGREGSKEKENWREGRQRGDGGRKSRFVILTKPQSSEIYSILATWNWKSWHMEMHSSSHKWYYTRTHVAARRRGGEGGWRITRQLSGFSKDNSTHLKKVIVIKMIQLICVWWVLQVDTCYRGGGESTLGYQRRIVLHLYVKLNYPDIANQILFLVFVFLFWSFSVFIFLFWYFSVLSFCLEKGKQNYIRAVLHCDIFF